MPTTAIRSLVTNALTGEALPAQKAVAELEPIALVPTPDVGAKKDLRIYFSPSEYATLSDVAVTVGMGIPEFVIAAVRAALTQTPTYGQAELVALIAANDALSNAVAALRLAKETSALGSEVVEGIDDLRDEIKRHTVAISAVLAQGTRRWQLKV